MYTKIKARVRDSNRQSGTDLTGGVGVILNSNDIMVSIKESSPVLYISETDPQTYSPGQGSILERAALASQPEILIWRKHQCK